MNVPEPGRPWPDLVIIRGAPGSGKSSLMKALSKELGYPPTIEFSALREIHLDPLWTRANDTEESIAAENFVTLVRNYVKHGIKPVLATDFREHRIESLLKDFADINVCLLTMVASDADIAKRINVRTVGFVDKSTAVAWNQMVAGSPLIKDEWRLDTSTNNRPRVLRWALEVVLSGR